MIPDKSIIILANFMLRRWLNKDINMFLKIQKLKQLENKK